MTCGTGLRCESTPYERNIIDFHGGVHLRLPVPESRVVPYIVGGAGVLHFLPSDTSARFYTASTNALLREEKLNLSSANAFAVNGGAGVRIYATERVGFRAEFKIFKPANMSEIGSFYRFAFGMFIQLH